jgi:hypothetical protein
LIRCVLLILRPTEASPTHWSTKDIAQRLDLSVHTLETHRAQIKDRREIRDIAFPVS